MEYLTTMVIFQEAGVPRPDPNVFSLALLQWGHEEKDDVILLGDNDYDNRWGGRNFGVDTMWYHPAGKPTQKFILTYTVRNYQEIYEIL